MTSRRHESLKIVQIETRYIETEAVNFKAVVQSLTGKDSSTAWVGNGSEMAGSGKKEQVSNGGVAVKPKEDSRNCYYRDGVISSMFLKSLSFKDFDRIFSENTSTEELPWF